MPFGHQMLAWALSGPQYVRRAPIPELGWVAVDLSERDLLFSGVTTPWHAFAAHLDEVVLPPAPWRVLASNAACAVQTMRCGDRPVRGIQPHPETPPDHARVLMQAASANTPSTPTPSDKPSHLPFATKHDADDRRGVPRAARLISAGAISDTAGPSEPRGATIGLERAGASSR